MFTEIILRQTGVTAAATAPDRCNHARHRPGMSFFNAWTRAWVMVLVLLPGCGQGGDVDAYLRSSQIAIAAGEYDAASLALNNVLQARPDDTSARLQLARVALVAGRPGLAERQARAATRIAPDNEAGKQLLCEALRHLGDFNSIVSEFIGATSAPLLTCRGFAYLHLGSGAEAHRLFAQAIDAAPGSIEPRIGLAQSEQALGNLPAAQRQLKADIERRPVQYRGVQRAGLCSRAARAVRGSSVGFPRRRGPAARSGKHLRLAAGTRRPGGDLLAAG